MESDSFWRYVVVGREATDTSCNNGNHIQTLGKINFTKTVVKYWNGAQGVCEISVLGDTKNLTSHGPALSVRCFGQGWDHMTFSGAFKSILVYDPTTKS